MVYDHLPSFLKETLLEKKQALHKAHPNLSAAAFLDFDGSLIDGDITEGKKSDPAYLGLLERIVSQGALPGFAGANGASKFWHQYENNVSPWEAWIWVATVLSNLPPDEDKILKAFVREHLATMVPKFLFSFAQDLLKFCHTEKIVPFVVSASPHYFIEELAHFLPIEAGNLFGLNGKRNQAGFLDSNLHDSAGKARRVAELCQANPVRPLLALGNKWRWDGGMIRSVCEQGGVGLLVNEDKPKDFSHPSLHCLLIS